jgi:hypothetical protein
LGAVLRIDENQHEGRVIEVGFCLWLDRDDSENKRTLMCPSQPEGLPSVVPMILGILQ